MLITLLPYLFQDETLEIDAGELDTGDDETFVPPSRKSLRLKGSAQRFDYLAEGDGTKKKRGRPPNVIDPVHCNVCGERFTIAKEYRRHRVRTW